jgi:hypothetical protein
MMTLEVARFALLMVILAFSVQANDRAKRIVRERRDATERFQRPGGVKMRGVKSQIHLSTEDTEEMRALSGYLLSVPQ